VLLVALTGYGRNKPAAFGIPADHHLVKPAGLTTSRYCCLLLDVPGLPQNGFKVKALFILVLLLAIDTE
jgi:hypothetical protein